MRPSKILYGCVVRLLGEGALFERLRTLERLERLPPAELRRLQTVNLAQALRYAKDRSPWYRRLLAGLPAIREENAVEVLRRLPFLTKADLQERRADLLASPSPGRSTWKTTGGSTGEPVSVLKDRHATAFERAAMWLGYGWFGVEMGDPAARFWGTPQTGRRRVLARLGDAAMNRIRFSAFAFDEEDLGSYWVRCRSYHPAYLHGYVSMLESLARYGASRGLDGREFGLKAIVATSEVLTDPQRELIESVFRAPVQVEYGCGEMGPIAYECERGSLHLMTPNLFIEILGPNGEPVESGETGEIVLTDLHNRAMPLVRYRLGDQAVPGASCDCGRGFPVIDRIWGRAYDFVEAPDGRRYHGEFFMYIFEDLRDRGFAIRQFQVVQTGPAMLEVRIKSEGHLQASAERAIRRLFQERLAAMELRIREVSRIQRSASGKLRVIINECAAASWRHPE